MTIWFALHVNANLGAQEHILAFFQDGDVTGIQEQDDGSGLIIYRDTPWNQDVMTQAMESVVVSAGFTKPNIHFTEVIEEDWLAEWKSHWEPLALGKRMWIVPAWWDDATPPLGRFSLRIEPGMAFGTGTHETTALAWELLETVLETTEDISTLLELGLGTGLLSLGAANLHPEMTILGTEGDPRAIPSLQANLSLNPQISINCVLAQSVPVSNAWAKIGVVNMTHAEHLVVRESLHHAMAPRSRLIFSGLFPHQAEELGKWWSQKGFTLEKQLSKGEWAALSLVRTPLS
jgi:ribosomal protein L11 methyltransferase